jgi:hypothetical protein
VTKRGPKKPAREMTNEEAAERLFGKRIIKKVRKELGSSEPTEKKEKSCEKASTKKKDT